MFLKRLVRMDSGYERPPSTVQFNLIIERCSTQNRLNYFLGMLKNFLLFSITNKRISEVMVVGAMHF